MTTVPEWLEPDGLGGFASGTASGIRTRRYHALLLCATSPPTGRVVLVNGFEAWVETPAGRWAITSQAYAQDVVHPDGAGRIERFDAAPWPRWIHRLGDGTGLGCELFVPHENAAAVLHWWLEGGARAATLEVRPLLSGRDYHSLHHENAAFDFSADAEGERVRWAPYPGLPGIVSRSNGAYTHAPQWYRRFSYAAERERGLDHVEDLASPGVLRFDLARGDAVWLIAAAGHAPRLDSAAAEGEGSALPAARALRASEQARRAVGTRLEAAARGYVVRRGSGKTIVAGYPWFTDWGRDTFIAMRGLCIATGRLDDARSILVEWAGTVSEGMLPNRFPDSGGEPEFNSVDASLWYVVAVGDLVAAAKRGDVDVSRQELARLTDAVDAILDGYARGTRFGIRADDDGLLAAGVAGAQLTWMDAKVGDEVVTPRIGKPVEVQALWLNALAIGATLAPRSRHAELFERGRSAFAPRFWSEERGHLHDVIDVDHVAGRVDGSLRPNQVFAIGGLPLALVDGERARRIVDVVERRLLTRLGLRSLAPGEPGYVPHYAGGVRERDFAYHQGTVWPWLLGPFVEAWVRVRGDTSGARGEARERFLAPLLRHLDEAGLGHVSEIADAEWPHTPRGCPFQAWSAGEALRLDRVVLAG